jgi:hypothetical protein
MAAISTDEAQSSLNRNVAVQYKIRHNGAKSLRSASIHIAWYQHLLLDVAAFVTVIVPITVVVSYSSLKKICLYLFAKCYE